MKPTHIRTLWQLFVIGIFALLVATSFWLEAHALFPFSLIGSWQANGGMLGTIAESGRLTFLFFVLTWLVLGAICFPILLFLKKHIEKKHGISLSAQK
jgi:hypothetical protein